MANPKITFACTLYDRLLALRLGEVKVEGFDLDYESSYGTDNVRAIFDRVGAGKGTDVSEMSTSEFISGVATGKSRHVAIPVFPSRVFRCGFTFVNRDRIRQPKDLEGKRIGVPLYTMTAAVCARGHLSDEYGVDFSKVEWVQGAMNEAKPHGNPSAPPLLKPVNIVQNNSGKSLSQLLAAAAHEARRLLDFDRRVWCELTAWVFEPLRAEAHAATHHQRLRLGPAEVESARAAIRAIEEAHSKGEVLTGILYMNPEGENFHDLLNTVDEPLATLPLSVTRPPKSALDEIMEELR